MIACNVSPCFILGIKGLYIGFKIVFVVGLESSTKKFHYHTNVFPTTWQLVREERGNNRPCICSSSAPLLVLFDSLFVVIFFYFVFVLVHLKFNCYPFKL